MAANEQTDERDTTLREAREPYVALTLVCLAAPLIWVVHFAVVYLAEGFICTREAWPASWVALIVALATLLLGSACLWLVISPGYWLKRAGAARVTQETRRFLEQFTRWMAGLSLLAIAWVGSGVLMVDACQSAGGAYSAVTRQTLLPTSSATRSAPDEWCRTGPVVSVLGQRKRRALVMRVAWSGDPQL